MIKSLCSLLTLAGMMNLSVAAATEIGRIDMVQDSAWLQRDSGRLALAPGIPLKTGDSIATDSKGRASLVLWSDVSLVLNQDSELSLLGDAVGAGEGAGLYLHRGVACIDFNPQQDRGGALVVDIGHMLTAALRHEARICALREDQQTVLSLRAGSVQLSHAVDPSTIVISETGTEIRFDDDGEFSLLTPDADEDLTVFDESALPQAAAAEVDAAAGVDAGSHSGAANTETAPADETGTTPVASAEAGGGVKSTYSYTVYLFSTGSQRVADEVNQQLHDAGHDTRIIVTGNDSETRYRIAMPGFENRDEAEVFAAAMLGNYGIGSTWIGRQKVNAD